MPGGGGSAGREAGGEPSMEFQDGEEDKAQKIGRKAVDGQHAQQGLQGDEQAQEPADQRRGIRGIGLGLGAGEMRDAGDIRAHG